MIRRIEVGMLVVFLCVTQVITLVRSSAAWKQLPRDERTVGAIPASLLKITALDYDGIVSDYLFLKALVFMGSTFERKERPRVKDWEWKWLYNILDASAGLDPYFRDPYYFGNANLVWEGGLVRETNELLARGTQARSWDHLLPFFMGFNYFYFLQDYEKASDALMTASERPGATPLYASLAAKMAFKANRTETAIALLTIMIRKTDDELLRGEYQNRLQIIRTIFFLEKTVQEYRKRFGRTPETIEALVRKGLIESAPQHPSGGSFYIDKKGDVRTTNEDLVMPYLRKK